MDRARPDRWRDRQGDHAGTDPGGIIVTILIGIVGAFLGGFLGNLITGTGLNGFSLWSIVLAIVGSLILLWIYRATTRSRGNDEPVGNG